MRHDSDTERIRDFRKRLSAATARARGSQFQRIRRQPIRLPVAELLRRISLRLGLGIRCRARTFWGGRMTVIIPEAMSNGIFRYGYCEPDLSAMFLDVVRPGMTVFDVGAHFGYATLLASTLVGDSGAVYAFEPTPSTFEVLQANTRDIGTVTAINVAVYSSRQSLAFHDLGLQRSSLNSLFDPRAGGSSDERAAGTVRTISTLSIDDYVLETGVRPDVVKIDAESAEYQILLGMQQTLDDLRPIIVMEVGDVGVAGAAPSSDLVKFLVDRGYDVFGVVDGRLDPEQIAGAYTPGNRLFVPRAR